MNRPHHFFCIFRTSHDDEENEQVTVPATQSTDPAGNQEDEAMSSERTATEYPSSHENDDIAQADDSQPRGEWRPSNTQSGDASAGDTPHNSDSEGDSY